jgi:hypothetical protein
MRNKIEIQRVLEFYDITADGQVYSKIKKRWLKPQLNNSGYVHYWFLPYRKFIFIHTLVALKYIGEPPTELHEVNHKDENKSNNHYSNLEWLTKSENHLKAYQNGKNHYWLNKNRPSPGVAARIKMANAKNKRILFVFKDQRIIYESINEAASQLQTYRKKIYNCIRENRSFKGGFFSVLDDTRPDESI